MIDNDDNNIICVKCDIIIKGEEESTDKSGLSCINLKVNNKIKSHNQITRRRSFSCIGLSKGTSRHLFKIYSAFPLTLNSRHVCVYRCIIIKIVVRSLTFIELK